jgi:glycosyltransferase involved in cell wall biosynthesis
MDRESNDSQERSGISMTSNPLISIIVPYHNLEAYIGETVSSALRQTYPNLEIIVVDDGSTVPVTSCLSGLQTIKIVRTENRGCAAARNFGFAHSSGEFLIFLDGDDLLMPGAIEAHLRAFKRKPEASLSFGPVRIIDEFGLEKRAAHVCRPRENYFPMLLESNPIECPGGAMIRRDAFEEAGLFDERLRNAEDYHLYLRLARRHSFVQHAFCVVEYRKHSGGKSQQKERMLATVMTVLDQIERSEDLSPSEHRRLLHGRRRWHHAFRPKDTLSYRIRTLYYGFRAMLTVSVWHYLRGDRNVY